MTNQPSVAKFIVPDFPISVLSAKFGVLQGNRTLPIKSRPFLHLGDDSK